MLNRNRQNPAAQNSALEWLGPGRFAILLAMAIAARFPAVLLGLKAFAYGDAAQFAYPVAFYYRQSFWRGEIPFWNPLNSCGIPFLAQWNTMTLYPLSLFYLLLPMPWSFDVFCLAHLFLGGMGMYFLACRWTGNRLGSALAGLVFAFNGLTWYGVMWPHLIAALGWMPWVMLATERAWRDGGKFVIFAALAAGMQLLSGGAEVILQTWIVLAVFWLANFFQTPKSVWKLLARGGIAGLLAAGLAMAQLLPFLRLLSNSQRTTGYAASDIGIIAAMPLSGWVNYLVPLFHSVPDYAGVCLQPTQGWTGSYYLGVGIIAFALLAVWRVRDWRVWLLAALALFGFIMALGPAGFLYSVVIRLAPVLGFVRFPAKFVFLPTFALPLLAAFGLSWLMNVTPAQWPKEWTMAKGLTVALLILIGGIVWFDKLHPMAGAATDRVLVNACVRCLFLLAAMACVPLLRQIESAKLQRAAQFSLLFLAWLDVSTHAPNLSPTVAASAWAPDAARQFFHWDNQLRAGTSRAMRSKNTFWKLLSNGAPDPDLDLQIRRLSLFMNLNLADSVAKFDGFYSLDLKQHLDVFKHVYFTTNEAPGLLDFMGISEIGNSSNLLAWVRRDSYHPMVTIGQQPVYLGATQTLAAIFENGFNPSQSVFLPEEAQGMVQANKSSRAEILSPHFQASRLDFDAQSDSAAMVVVAQTYYPAWHAYVDGKATPLWRANYAFQSLEVPAGKHQVSLIYEDRAFYWGSIISIVSLLSCGAGLFTMCARRI